MVMISLIYFFWCFYEVIRFVLFKIFYISRIVKVLKKVMFGFFCFWMDKINNKKKIYIMISCRICLIIVLE